MSDITRIDKLSELLNNFKAVSKTNSSNLNLLGILVGVLVIVVIVMIVFYYQLIQRLQKIIYKYNKGLILEINKLSPNVGEKQRNISSYWNQYF